MVDSGYSNRRLLYPQRVVCVTNLNIRPAQSALSGTCSKDACRRHGRRVFPARILWSVCFFISTTGLPANYAHLAAQQVTTVAPPRADAGEVLPNAPGAVEFDGAAFHDDVGVEDWEG